MNTVVVKYYAPKFTTYCENLKNYDGKIMIPIVSNEVKRFHETRCKKAMIAISLVS